MTQVSEQKQVNAKRAAYALMCAAIDDAKRISEISANHTLSTPRRLQQMIDHLIVLYCELDAAGFTTDADTLSEATGLMESVRDRFAVLR